MTGLRSVLGATVALMLSLPAIATASADGLQAAPPGALTDRLASVRNDVFTRPDRRDQSVKQLHEIIALDPTLAEPHMLLGIIHSSRGTSDMQAEAVAEFRQALDLDPAFVPARFYLAHVYFELGLIDRARDELTILTERVPGGAQFRATLGEAERRLGNPTRAVALTREALAIDPTSVEARYYQGLAQADLGQMNDAIASFEAVLKMRPTMADAQLSLGVAYLSAGQLDGAIAALERGLQLAPPKPRTRIFLARAYRLKGRLTAAEAELDRALPPGAAMEASTEFERIEVDLLIERGLVRLAEKRPALARQFFDKALTMNPSPEAKARIDTALQSMKGPAR